MPQADTFAKPTGGERIRHRADTGVVLGVRGHGGEHKARVSPLKGVAITVVPVFVIVAASVSHAMVSGRPHPPPSSEQ